MPSFDFIIIGGGTAGCVLGNRLSENAVIRVLLLEAGPDNNDDHLVRTPLTSRRMFKDPKYDWGYETVPQQGLEGRVIQHTRGRMLGGSSAINSHSLLFPNQAMHNAWAELVGDVSWAWPEMKDWYDKFHAVQDGNSVLPEAEGRIAASFPKKMDALQQAWEDVFESLGAKPVEAATLGRTLGGFTTTNAIDGRPGKGERSHSGNTYLKPVLHRKNLVVKTGALVQRVMLEKTDAAELRATSVMYEHNGTAKTADASKEVILCAGAFGSPQVLELSGIGQQVVLEKFGIDCLIDLPGVGENLQDHLNFGPSVEVNQNIETMDALRKPEVAAAQREIYEKNRSGPLAEGAAYSFAYWPLQLFNTKDDERDLRRIVETNRLSSPNLHDDFIQNMILSPYEASASVFMTRMQRYTSPGTELPGNYMTVVAMLSHPFSRGSTHIQSSEPSQHPRIDFAYLSDPLDAEILARHVLQINKILDQPVYANIVKPGGRHIPDMPLTTAEEAIQAIQKYGATNYHPCGTCSMTKRDLAGVVDGQLRVYGTTNLRICDASIFPIIPRANILSTVYAVAEKTAKMILAST